MDGITSVTPFPYGTYSTDDWSANLGQRGRGKDTDTIAGAITNNSANGRREHVLVQNASGTTLSPGMGLKFTTGFFGTKVDKCSSGVSIVGFVRPAINGSISTTIPDGAYFWMVKEGFTSVLKTTANVTEQAQMEASATAGQVKANSGTAVYDVVAGTFIATDSGGTSNLVRSYVNCQW